MRMLVQTLVLAISFSWAQAQSNEPVHAPVSTLVKAGRLLDVRKGEYVENAAILVEGERVKEAGPASQVEPHAPRDARVIDLGRATVIPGLIDCHTHLMARSSDSPDHYILALAKKSQAYRALEGAADARATLLAGFTAVRDVENEGSGYADVALRDAINEGLVEGPRMQVATRAIAAVGQYNPFGVSPDLPDFPTGAQMVSGEEEARRAAREQIGQGADLIKIYADWTHPTLTVEEMTAIVEEAHKAGLKVAAHATTVDGIKNALKAGVDSIEHGHRADRQAIEIMKAKGVFLVPTVAVIDAQAKAIGPGQLTPAQRTRFDAFVQGTFDEVATAKKLGVKIASGSDASSAEEHGRNATELASMVKRGLTPLEAIQAATINAAELMSWQDRVGAVETGKFADLIAVEGDPLLDITVLQSVKFVMKGGAVIRSN